MTGRPMSQRDHPGDTNRTPYGSGAAEDRKAFYLACLGFDTLPGSRINASRRRERVRGSAYSRSPGLDGLATIY